MKNFDSFLNKKEQSKTPHDVLQSLRELSLNVHALSPTQKQEQQILINELHQRAEAILVEVETGDLLSEQKHELMGQYGYIMDQMAISLPVEAVRDGAKQNMQTEALAALKSYAEDNPDAAKVMRWIFMLYHHGAGIEHDMTMEDFEKAQKKDPAKAQAFIEQEIAAAENAKEYLEKYLQLRLQRDDFSLDTDFDDLISREINTEDQAMDLLDVANWYRRIAYFQKLANHEEQREALANRALELHKKLAAYDPELQTYLKMLIEEQGLER